VISIVRGNPAVISGDSMIVEVYSEPENKNPVEIAQMQSNMLKQTDLTLLLSVAGRLAVDKEMMDEIAL
jgi:signal recognition particle subunit SRP54